MSIKNQADGFSKVLFVCEDDYRCLRETSSTKAGTCATTVHQTLPFCSCSDVALLAKCPQGQIQYVDL